MNYLAHAIDVLDTPWVLAGTSLPDWLRVVDRRARLRPEPLRALPLASGSPDAGVRDGVVRHHDDDARFHADPVFEELSHEAVRAIRPLSPDPRLRASALGHILVEMLLDASVAEARPGVLERYYDALDEIDDELLASLARAWTRAPLAELPHLLGRFRRARFLFSYASDEGVVDALEGVCWRAGLAPPPPGIVDVVAALRPKVGCAAAALLGRSETKTSG